MSEKQPAEGASSEGGSRDRWREVLAAIDDRILRACLPKDPQSITQSGDELVIAVDSEFKKEYCLRKQAKLEENVARVMGPRRLVIGEPPLIEKAREVRPRVETSGRIGVLGVGDGGVNAIDRMREEHLQGVRLVAVDTDKQVLGMSRAVGETMIVAIAAGQQPRFTLDPRVPVETMTAYIMQVSLGDTPTGTLEYRTIFAVAMTLFLFTFVLNGFAHWLRRRMLKGTT